MAEAEVKDWAVAKTVHVTFLVDRSGSMSSLRSDVIGGFNSFLKEQREQDGTCFLTVHQFDSQGFDTLFDGVEIGEVRDAMESDFQPRGGTPLYDSIGRAITHAQLRAESEQGKKEQPIFVILTDGMENASREYRREQVFELIQKKEREGWVFTYLGANQDAYAAGAGMGIHAGATMNFVADSQGVGETYSNLSASISDARVRTAAGQMVNSANLYENTGKTAEEDWASRSLKDDDQMSRSIAEKDWLSRKS